MKMTASTLPQRLYDGSLFTEQCPSCEALEYATSRWDALTLVALHDDTHRFSDLRRKMGGVNEKMLAQSLQVLEHDGFTNQVSYPVVPPHVEHSLTPLGEQVSDKVAALADWMELSLPQILVRRDERTTQFCRPDRTLSCHIRYENYLPKSS